MKKTAENPEVDVIALGGLRYRAIKNTTLQNDYYVMQQLQRSGIANITPNQGENAEAYAMRLLGAIVENGIPLKLLGGLIIPEEIKDAEWTPAQADTTAALLAQLTDKADKNRVQALIIEVVTDFFKEGLRLLKPFPGASQAAEVEAQPTEPGSEASSALNS